MPRYKSLQERIIANSYVSSDSAHNGTACWVWMGKVIWSNGTHGRAKSPYPVMTMRYKSGPRKGKVYNARVHRVVLREFKGPRMKPRCVGMHLCNNTLCVNPDHLWSGSQKKNVRQCVKEGRHKTPFRDAEKKRAL